MSLASEGRATAGGWRRYFTWNTDHKIIGVQYLVTTFCFFMLGGVLAMLVRAELAQPGPDPQIAILRLNIWPSSLPLTQSH